MVVAVVRIGPAAAWRGHKAFRNQVADLPLRNGGQLDQVTDIHGRAFRQKYCRKIRGRQGLSTFYLSKEWRTAPDRRNSAQHWGIAASAPDPPKDRGAGEITWPPDGVTFSTASPRWLVPSARKRNTPSMPAKPDALVSVSGAKRRGPCVFTSAATSATAS